MSEVVYLVTEQSAAGDTVLGIFSTLDEARQLLPPVTSGRLQEYRIQPHVLGERPDPRTPWCVVLTRDGNVESAAVAVT